ncbi:hypothetical protein N7499_006333 [Penicillium canescens]|nr:hypothetical protein N7499_006333 [Penicillium canescens]KAJ6176744.1 hypothetical protein N7485_003658 [Penicillium canescens]
MDKTHHAETYLRTFCFTAKKDKQLGPLRLAIIRPSDIGLMFMGRFPLRPPMLFQCWLMPQTSCTTKAFCAIESKTKFVYWMYTIQGQKERVLDLDHMTRHIIGIEYILSEVGEQTTLLRFSCDILILLFSQSNSNEGGLVAIDLEPHPDQARRRPLLLHEPVSSSDPIFVRHTHLYIWYGTFTAVYGRLNAWILWGMNFNTLRRTKFSIGLLLHGELGKKVCFEIYQGHLYVVYVIDEQESSFYHWSCYAPDHKNNRGNGRLWRRENREGPIHEMWADLSIQEDEEKGRPVILECRCEWLDRGSENHRTYYTTPLPTPDEALAMHSTEGLTHQSGLVDSDDEYSQSSEKRLARDCHPEHDISDPPDP